MFGRKRIAELEARLAAIADSLGDVRKVAEASAADAVRLGERIEGLSNAALKVSLDELHGEVDGLGKKVVAAESRGEVARRQQEASETRSDERLAAVETALSGLIAELERNLGRRFEVRE